VPITLAEGLANAAGLQAQWRFAAAREALAAALADEAGPAGGLAAVTGRRMLAEVLRDLGELDEAYAVAQVLVADCDQRFGAGHPVTARAVLALATVAHRRGDLDTAGPLYDRLVDGRFRDDGPAGRPVRLARAYQALLHRDRGEPGVGRGEGSSPDRTAALERARADLAVAYRGLRRAYGIADPDTIQFGAELARLARQCGDLATARRLASVTRAGCQARLDPWHPLRLQVEQDLAAIDPTPPHRPPADITMAGAEAQAAQPAEGGSAEPPGLDGMVPAPPPGKLPAQREAPSGGADAGAVVDATILEPAHPGPRRRRVRRKALVAALVAVALAGVGGTALAVSAGQRGHQPAVGGQPGAVRQPEVTQSPAAPSPTGREPLRVRLRDDSTSLTATWPAPPGEPAAVVVAVSRDGGPTTVVATIPPGTLSYTLTGVDPRAEYCLIVAAVHPGEAAAGATSACTHRTQQPR
jgi:hypothetical protein